MGLPNDPAASKPGRTCFVSWSGGKDSCLAMHRAVQAGDKPRFLFTMLTEDGRRSHSHGLHRDVLCAQAAALGLPVVFRTATWADYETQFAAGLRELAQAGATAGVFGDIDITSHRQWVERLCDGAGVTACEPLWQADRQALLDEFIAAGFQAIIVAVKDDVLSPDLLGRPLNTALVEELLAAGVDASGERGEYHTVVTAGPLFIRPIRLRPLGRVLRDGYWFLNLAIDPPGSLDSLPPVR